MAGKAGAVIAIGTIAGLGALVLMSRSAKAAPKRGGRGGADDHLDEEGLTLDEGQEGATPTAKDVEYVEDINFINQTYNQAIAIGTRAAWASAAKKLRQYDFGSQAAASQATQAINSLEAMIAQYDQEVAASAQTDGWEP